MSMPFDRGVRNQPLGATCRLPTAEARRRGRRRGAAALEFALVAPLFFIIVFTMFEFGRYMMVQQIITDTAREGARRALLEGADPDAVEDFVLNMLEANTIDGTKTQVQVTPSDFGPLWLGDEINVKVRVNYNEMSWISHIWFYGDPWMEANCTMSVERPE